MNTAVKWILISVGAIIVFFALVVLLFIIEMTPDRSEEKAVKENAQQYIHRHYSGQMEIYDTLYDNMGNFSDFTYAAKVRDTSNGLQFLIYDRNGEGAMGDDYAISALEEELEEAILDEIDERFFNTSMISTTYTDDDLPLGYQGTTTIPSIQEMEFSEPTIGIWLTRKKQPADERKVAELIAILQDKVNVPHASVIVHYQGMERGEGSYVESY